MQYGLTLIELSIVLMILAALAVVTTRFMFDEFDRTIADKTVAEMWAVGEYSVAFIAENNEWPGQRTYDSVSGTYSDDNCIDAAKAMEDAGLLSGLSIRDATTAGSTPGSTRNIRAIESPWHDESTSSLAVYTFSCDSGSPEKGLTISLDLPNFAGGQSAEEWAQYLLQKLPLAQLDSTKKKVTLTIPPPSGVFALRDYLSRKEDPNRDAHNSDGNESLNDLGHDTVINLNTQVADASGNPILSVTPKIVDFDVDEPHDFDGDSSPDFFTESTAIYSLNMPRTSVFNRLVLIPTTDTPRLEVDAPQYESQNCRKGSPGGFALEVCEKDYDDHVAAQSTPGEHDVGGTALKTAGQPQGSIKANDIYLTSVGKWASEIDKEFQQEWVLVKHYTDVANTAVITYSTCDTTREAKYEVWPQKISLSSKPANTNDGTYEYIYSNFRHSFSVSDTGVVSIIWTVREEKDDGTNVDTEENRVFGDSSSTAFANVYCVKKSS